MLQWLSLSGNEIKVLCINVSLMEQLLYWWIIEQQQQQKEQLHCPVVAALIFYSEVQKLYSFNLFNGNHK